MWHHKRGRFKLPAKHKLDKKWSCFRSEIVNLAPPTFDIYDWHEHVRQELPPKKGRFSYKELFGVSPPSPTFPRPLWHRLFTHSQVTCCPPSSATSTTPWCPMSSDGEAAASSVSQLVKGSLTNSGSAYLLVNTTGVTPLVTSPPHPTHPHTHTIPFWWASNFRSPYFFPFEKNAFREGFHIMEEIWPACELDCGTSLCALK